MAYKVSVVIEKDENGYCAYCPQLAGCHSQGDTFEQVAEHIEEAIALYLEDRSFDVVIQRIASRDEAAG